MGNIKVHTIELLTAVDKIMEASKWKGGKKMEEVQKRDRGKSGLNEDVSDQKEMSIMQQVV